MSKNSMKFVGLMSGSSLDGLDIALCQFDIKGNSFTGSIEKAITVPFPKTLAKRLSQGALLDAYALSLLDHDFGKWCGEQVAKHFSKKEFSAIASHGHTLLHHPEKGLINEVDSLKIICNCRKPKAGLLDRALKEHKIEPKHSIYFGDSHVDYRAAQKMKIKFEYVNEFGFKDKSELASKMKKIIN